MTREGIACDKFEMLMVEGKKEAEQWKIVMEQKVHAKATANEKVMECKLKYHKMMKNLRLEVSGNINLR